VPIFTNYKSLTFVAVGGLVKVAWEGAKLLPGARLDTVWFPFIACLIFALLISISNLIEEKPPVFGWIFGLIFGLVNSLVIFAAVMGVTAKS
jgi:hypothetical protein